jgi:xanthine dehydrogenase large subunit
LELLENEEPSNVRGSKAVGEPPLLLGFAAWAAVKNALSSTQAHYNPPLRLPATAEDILSCLK